MVKEAKEENGRKKGYLIMGTKKVAIFGRRKVLSGWIRAFKRLCFFNGRCFVCD